MKPIPRECSRSLVKVLRVVATLALVSVIVFSSHSTRAQLAMAEPLEGESKLIAKIIAAGRDVILIRAHLENGKLVAKATDKTLKDRVTGLASDPVREAAILSGDIGATLQDLQEFSELTALTISGGEISANDIRLFGKWPKLTSLHLADCRLDSSATEALGRCSNLRSLTLSGDAFSDSWLQNYIAPPNISDFGLANNSYRGRTIKPLLEPEGLKVVRVVGKELGPTFISKVREIVGSRRVEISVNGKIIHH